MSVVGKSFQGWALRYEGFVPHQGRADAKPSAPWATGTSPPGGRPPRPRADEIHYPGTYVAGVFNRRQHGDRRPHRREREHRQSPPTGCPRGFRIDDGAWFGPRWDGEVLEYEQQLDLRHGVLSREGAPEGRRRPHHHRPTPTPLREHGGRSPRGRHRDGRHRTEDWSGRLTVRSGLDGSVSNTGVARYREFDNDHRDRRGHRAGRRGGHRPGGGDQPVRDPGGGGRSDPGCSAVTSRSA